MKQGLFKILLVLSLSITFNLSIAFAKKEAFEIEENDFKKNLNLLTKSSYKKDNIDFSAQHINYNLKDETITATGKVTFISEGNIITSDTLYYNAKNDILYIKGNVVFMNENNHKIYSEEAIFDPKLNTGLIEKFKTIFADQSTMLAQNVDKNNDETYNLKKMSFTACKIVNDYKPTWEIKAQKAVYNEKDSEVALYNSWLEVKGVPILWTPYFSFSNLDFIRKAGFLTPSYENNSLYGYGAIVPFYVPLGDSQEILIETHSFTGSNPLFLANYKGFIEDGSFSSSFSFVNKQFKQGQIDEQTRWHAFFYGQKDLSDTWRANIKIEEASDINYLRNYNLDKKNSAESFYIDQLELEGFFNQNSYFDTYIVKFETINPNFIPKNPDTNSISSLNNTFNMNYSYFSDYSSLGKIKLFMNADNLFTKDNDQLSRFVTNVNYKYYIPTYLGNYSFDALAQNVIYSDASSEKKFVEDSLSTNVATSITYEYPLLYEINDFVYSVSPIFQLSYAKILNENQNTFLIDSHNLNINSNNLFELNHFQGFDQFEEGKDLKYALKFSMLNDTNQGSRLFIGQRFHTGITDEFIQNINESSASNYFISLYLYPTENIYLIYNGVIDKKFAKGETSFTAGYNNKLFAIEAGFDEYNQLDSTLYNVDRISELRINGVININQNIRLASTYLLDISPSYKTEIKTSTFNFIWANECLEIIFYNNKDYYTEESPNTWGFRVNIKSIDGYKFTK